MNPASGPGGANTQPNSDYTGCIPKLVASNSKILGYVDTGNGGRASSAVSQDITTYAGWHSGYRPTGIFFDQVNPTSTYYSSYSTWSQDVTSAGFNYVCRTSHSNSRTALNVLSAGTHESWRSG